MGGRGSSSSISLTGRRNSAIFATPNTQAEHMSKVTALASASYSDGTYDLDSMTPVEYSRGYQVTFSQIGDRYSAAEYADRVNEFLAVSSDGKTLAGKFEGTPEISFHVSNKRVAVRLAKKYNQISIWDWGNCDEIKTGGTGRHGN